MASVFPSIIVMPRRQGSKDNAPRERRPESAVEKARKAATKQATAEKKAKAAKEAFVRRMNGAQSAGAGMAAGSSAADAGVDIPPFDDGDDVEEAGEAGMESDADEAQAPPAADDQGRDAAHPRREQRPADVDAELDDDEQLANADSSGVMGTYLKAVYDRLHSEVCGPASRSVLEPKWLLAMCSRRPRLTGGCARARHAHGSVGIDVYFYTSRSCRNFQTSLKSRLARQMALDLPSGSGARYKVLGSDSAPVRTLPWSRCTHTGRDFVRPKVLHTVQKR